MLSQTTTGSHESGTQAHNLSNSFASTAARQHPSSNIHSNAHSNNSLLVGFPTSEDLGISPSVSSFDSRVQSSENPFGNRLSSGHGFRPYQIQSEPTRHPQYSTVRAVVRAPLGVEKADLCSPSSASITLSKMSIETLSQILPPKRDLPFQVQPTKRPRLEALGSSTLEDSPKSVKAVRNARGAKATAAPEEVAAQRVSPKTIMPESARAVFLMAENNSSNKVGMKEIAHRKTTPEQASQKRATLKQTLSKKPRSFEDAELNMPIIEQNTTPGVSRVSSKVCANPEVSPRSLDPSSLGTYLTIGF